MTFPADDPERSEAGVPGRLIQIDQNRPFEDWTQNEIVEIHGEVACSLPGRAGTPFVVTDDIPGTSTFLRALAHYYVSPGSRPLTSICYTSHKSR